MPLRNKIINILNATKKYFLIPFCIFAFIIFILINTFGIKIYFINPAHYLYIELLLGLIIFFIWFNDLSSKFKIIILKIFSDLFVITLLLITLAGFITKINLSPTANILLNFLLIFSGFTIFYTNKNVINVEIENEKINETEMEQERDGKFHKTFQKINKIPILKSVLAWMYKEGWGYVSILFLILLTGFILRSWNLNYLQGSDNFNLLAAKNFANNNHFIYSRDLQLTYLVGFLFKIFGVSFVVAKTPFVIIGTISIFLIYALGKTINKKVGLLSAALLALSPFAIEQSSIIREYSEILMWSIITIYFLLNLYIKHGCAPKLFIKKYITYVSVISMFVYLYGYITNTGTFKSILCIIFFISIPIIFYFIKDNYQKLLPYYVLLTSLILIIFIKFINIPINLFSANFVYTPYWYKMFFDPMVQTPMQWFSFSQISVITITSIFLITALVKSRKVFILQFGFWSIVLLFIFKYYSPLGYYFSRYLYFVYPFYIVLFGFSIYLITILLKVLNAKKIIYIIFLAFLLSNVIIITNTTHAAVHDFSIWGDTNNERQPTDYGNRNSFLNVINLLKENGLTNKKAIVIQGEGNIFLTWYFNYPITGIYNGAKGDSYEIGDKVYMVDPANGINQLDIAINKYPSGYLLWHSSAHGENDFQYNNMHFKYLGMSDGYKLFIWN